MVIEALTTHRDLVVMLTAAISIFCVVLSISWPYFARDKMALRMERVLAGNTRNQPRKTLPSGESHRPLLLLSEPSKIMAAIVERLRLGDKLEDKATFQKMRSAGFRGRAPVITFLAMRFVMPLVVMGVVAFYIFVVIQPELHLVAEISIILATGYFGYFLPTIYVNNKIAKRQKSIKRAWPDALDLLLICVESGMSSEHAFRKVADEIVRQSKELAEELSLTTAELSLLSDRQTAYKNLGKRTNLDSVKSVVSGLVQSEKYGTSLGHALRVLAQESRTTRMSEAEKKAAGLPPKLTVPMIIFFLPVLFAVVITPAVIQIINT